MFYSDSELDARLGPNTLFTEGVLDFPHFGDQIGQLDQLRWCAAALGHLGFESASETDVEPDRRGKSRGGESRHFRVLLVEHVLQP